MPSVEWLESPTPADLRPICDMLNAWNAEVVPGDRPAPVEELEATIKRAPAHRSAHLLVAEEHGSLLGSALMFMDDLEGRRRDANVDFLLVDPAARRQGIGSSLLEATAARARASGRQRLCGAAAAGDPAAAGFAARHSVEPEMIERQNRLRTTDIDADVLRAWMQRSAERASEYALVHLDGVCPDDLLDPLARLNDVMNTAPHGPNLEDLLLSADDLRDMQRAYDAQGYRRWTVIARHEPSGELAGFTELMISPFRPWMAFQWDTGVDPKHRNLGLGRWIKAANALRLLDEQPEVEEIETWNADSNASMLAINDAMGFRAVAEWQAWEMPL